MSNTDRPLMRQKINVTDQLINKWKSNYEFHNRNLINSSLMKTEDLYKTFEHQARNFEIIGMGEADVIMLREYNPIGVFYWEASRKFVQMKLSKFNREFLRLPNGKVQMIDIAYEETQLLLPPRGKKRISKTQKEDSSEDLEFDGNSNVVEDEHDTDFF